MHDKLERTLLAALLPPLAPPCSNACFGFDKTTGWTFFDLTTMHDNLDKSEGTVLEADFYHADQLLPRSDQDLVAKARQARHTSKQHSAAVVAVCFSMYGLCGASGHSTCARCPHVSLADERTTVDDFMSTTSNVVEHVGPQRNLGRRGGYDSLSPERQKMTWL